MFIFIGHPFEEALSTELITTIRANGVSEWPETASVVYPSTREQSGRLFLQLFKHSDDWHKKLSVRFVFRKRPV